MRWTPSIPRSRTGARASSRLPWLLAVPLMVGGSEAAHWLAYRLADPDPRVRARVLAESGHGYLDHAPLAAAIGLALVVVALARRTLAGGAGAGVAARLPALPFLLLPPLAFTLQEHLERLLHGGAFPFGAVLEPTFAPGLLLQAPFALAAYLVARLLLGVAREVGRLLAPRPPAPRVRGRRTAGRLGAAAGPPRRPALALGYGERGPPRPA